MLAALCLPGFVVVDLVLELQELLASPRQLPALLGDGLAAHGALGVKERSRRVIRDFGTLFGTLVGATRGLAVQLGFRGGLDAFRSRELAFQVD